VLGAVLATVRTKDTAGGRHSWIMVKDAGEESSRYTSLMAVNLVQVKRWRSKIFKVT